MISSVRTLSSPADCPAKSYKALNVGSFGAGGAAGGPGGGGGGGGTARAAGVLRAFPVPFESAATG
jgi:hypothetical protein